jgi:hypothetical protein
MPSSDFDFVPKPTGDNALVDPHQAALAPDPWRSGQNSPRPSACKANDGLTERW